MYVVPWARFAVDDVAVEATAIDACRVHDVNARLSIILT
jgi:hypothetical protein